jgi:hypothetical protein
MVLTLSADAIFTDMFHFRGSVILARVWLKFDGEGLLGTLRRGISKIYFQFQFI